MKVKVKRFDKDLPLPKYKTKGAVCFDLYAREDTVIEPGEIAYIPLNFAIDMPEGYWGFLAPRSSTHKMGIMAANAIGVGDADFCGDNDEYRFAAYNYTKKPVKIARGDRIAQFMLLKYEKIEIVEVDSLKNNDRGGFGTTGKKG